VTYRLVFPNAITCEHKTSAIPHTPSTVDASADDEKNLRRPRTKERMSIRGLTQLRALRLVYCDHTGSSKGAVDFIASGRFDAFRARVGAATADVVAEVRRGGDPHVTATYANGRTKTVGLKNASALDAEKQCEWLRSEKGKPGGAPMKRRHFTKRPSVQGQWTPFTFGPGAPYVESSP
jgi:large subunit ribosomal protein L43